jgi:14-3-3 protein beta/theta/zeta
MSKFTKFDLEALNFGAEANQRIALVSMARTAEGVERYEDMCEFMKKLVLYCCSQNPPLQLEDEERNLLSVAYKNVIGARRASWRTLVAEAESLAQNGGAKVELIQAYKNEVKEGLQATCNEVLNLLESSLLDKCDDEGEAKVFYLKMIGDYYRYLAESTESDSAAENSPGRNAATFYEKAHDIAKDKLQPTHPIRLGLALNYSVCFYEILKEKDKACTMAKTAFDEAISKLDQLEEGDYKDSTLIMQLLRDNLTLWTNDDLAEDE